MITNLPDSCGKKNMKKFFWDLDVENYGIGDVCFIGNKGQNGVGFIMRLVHHQIAHLKHQNAKTDLS